MPKFSAYDGSNDPFDHIKHYRQLMILDIGNEVLLCKVFPPSYKVRLSHGFTDYPRTLLITLGIYRKLLWGNTYAPLGINRTLALCKT